MNRALENIIIEIIHQYSFNFNIFKHASVNKL